MLQKANLPVTGKKEELIQRILQNESAQPKEEGSEDKEENKEQDNKQQSADTNGNDDTSKQPENAQQSTDIQAHSQEEQQQQQSDNTSTSKLDEARAELERKKARAQRFGQSTEQFEKEEHKVCMVAFDALNSLLTPYSCRS